MPELTPKPLTCPCCKRAFESQLVVGFSIGEKESDFCPRYLDGNPLPNFMHVCPGCGFVGYEADYRNLTDERKIEKIKRLLVGLLWEEGKKLGGAERYRRAALIALYLGKRSAEVADLYLQATWCSRMEGESDEEEKQARRKAVKYFELGLAADEFAPEDQPVVHYLVGELSRRLGEIKKARKHFAMIDELPHVEPWLKEWRDKQKKMLES
ncbi:MAG: DUF2225 domain-containing protein [Planctomycetes bacterium]|nr:DUF2225 domain-containing protein [Planctomycetota bacterium]